ncbi:MAG: 16S rRNA (cytosine(1402)-N(4))-methyltransferase RsmH [Clostridia bacterium]|nr:16S rRNA (cytosine(1402)-N(4))-methyltransferase RsmH [Clostridia bacterium]
MEYIHVPVLRDECINALNINPEGTYLDCTLGAGGHSCCILQRLTTGRLIGIDKDKDAIKHCEYEFRNYGDKMLIVQDDYKNAIEVLNNNGIGNVDGVLMDLGISSWQIDNYDRGFSYMHDGPLDMRMNVEQRLSAYEVVNNYSVEKLTDIIYKYGDEEYAKRIAQGIELQRRFGEIKSTLDLVKIIDDAVPQSYHKRGHVAKKTFQAIRIEVNQEMEGLREIVQKLIDRLNPQGRIVIISFHSLEDKTVKDCFRDNAIDCICPKDFPICICGHRAKVKIITKKPIIASFEELMKNSRAGSAKLRVAQRL